LTLETLKRALGAPAYEDEDVLLYHGDAMVLLDHLPAGSINLTVTSPPYNIGKAYETVKTVDDYVAWLAEWAAKIHRASAADGAFWLNLGYLAVPGRGKALPIPYLIWDKIAFFLVQEIVWNYGAGVAGRLFFSPRNEKWLWYVKDEHDYTFNLDDVRDKNVKYPAQKKNGRLKCNPLGKNPTDVWQIPKVTSGAKRSSAERTAHPAQFPLAVVTRILCASSEPGGLVLDPFAGSGSLLEAAILTGRKAVGFEINANYVDLAARRLAAQRRAAAAQGAQASLFGSARAVQDL
jgi:adenine-specific DNA-methyltransferase